VHNCLPCAYVRFVLFVRFYGDCFSGYSSVIATSISWRLAFILEAPLMFPFVILCWLLPEKRVGVGKPCVHFESCLAVVCAPVTVCVHRVAQFGPQLKLAGRRW
jgi:hypothetical protein